MSNNDIISVVPGTDPGVIQEVKTDKRLRVWVAIFYPESTKPDWQKIWEDNFICAAVSPVHDRDIYDTDTEDHAAGEFKKPHRHVVFRFDGSKSFNQVWDILRLIALDPAHCPPPQIPHGDIQACTQYLVHYNNKDKAPYLRSDIISINGFDVNRYFRLNSEQEDILFAELIRYLETNCIFEYWDLFKKLNISSKRDVIYEELFRYCRQHTILLTAILNSRRNMYKPKKKDGDKNDEALQQ